MGRPAIENALKNKINIRFVHIKGQNYPILYTEIIRNRATSNYTRVQTVDFSGWIQVAYHHAIMPISNSSKNILKLELIVFAVL